MHKYSTLLLTILMISGTLLSLIQLYATSDGLQYPLTASIYYLLSSLFIIFVFIIYSKEARRKILIVNSLIIVFFTIESLLFALICLYSLEPQSRVESLASSIFFFSGMIASGSIFFSRAEVKNSEETNTNPMLD